MDSTFKRASARREEPFAKNLPACSGRIGTESRIENKIDLITFNHINRFIRMLLFHKGTMIAPAPLESDASRSGRG